MKLCLFLTFIFQFSLSAATFSQQKKVNLDVKDVSVEMLFREIQQQTGYFFVFNCEQIGDLKLISVKAKEEEVDKVLDRILGTIGFKHKFENDIIVVTMDKTGRQQGQTIKKKTITGKVTDDKNSPLPGVSIFVKGTTVGVATDPDGKYKIEVPDIKDIIIVYRFVGMKLEERLIKDKKENLVINVVLSEEVNAMDEVVVTGIFNKAKESFTGAATFISKEELKQFSTRNLLRTINNIDPSFNIVENEANGSDPNKLPEINIRGTTSVPMNVEDVKNNERANLNTPLFIMDGFEISLERMFDLDEEEIESVTILKDASSTAIYGSRGANGVVVLTTVKPKAGKLRVNASANINLEIPDLSSYDLLNAKEKLELEVLAGLYKDENPEKERKYQSIYNKKLQSILEGVDTYWLSKPLQVGAGQQYRIGFSGGDPAFRYSLSASYNGTVGVMKGSLRNNFNGSVTISYLYKSLQINNSASVGINDSQESNYGSFQKYVALNPYWRSHDEEGKMIYNLSENDEIIGKKVNPLWDAVLPAYDTRRYLSVRNNTMVQWQPIESLKISMNFAVSKQTSETDKFLPATHSSFQEEPDVTKKGSYSYGVSHSQTTMGSLTLSYGKTIDKHSIFAGFNTDMRTSSSLNYGMAAEGFTHERLDFISNGARYKGEKPDGGENKHRAMGMTGNVNYNYNSCYYVDASYRLDGASSFGDQSRFKTFYSIGVGWTASRMKFFTDHISFIQTLRFRYNYGVSGALMSNSPYEAYTTYRYNQTERYNGLIGATIIGYGNPNLSWSYTYSHNLGMDLSIVKDIVSIGMNVYRKKTEGMVTKAKLALSHGYKEYTENQGDVLNEGIDANVSVRLLRKNGIQWSARVGIAQNRNKLLKLSAAMKDISKKAEISGLYDPNYLYREGESMDALYVVPSLGIDPATGREVFITKYGDPTYQWEVQNRKPYGVSQPKVNGRLSTTFRWNNLSVSASFALRLGGQKYNSTLISKVENANIKENVDKRVYAERWRVPGQYARFKKLAKEGSGGGQSSRFVQDESTIQFNSLNIDYSAPAKVTRFLHMKGLHFTARINDIFYISTVRKERGTSYPFSIKPTFSLSLNF